MKKQRDIDLPLQCNVEGDQLVIRIGVGTLAWASKNRNGGVIPNNFKVVDKHQLAADVANAITHDDELGNTMLGDMLDEATQDAMDRGSTGLVCPKRRHS